MIAAKIRDVFEGFPEKIMAIVLIGENGNARVWIDDEIETDAQREWARRNIVAASDIAIEMDPSAGHA